MRFVQLLLTDEQAELTAASLRDAEDALKAERLPDGDDPEANARVDEDIAKVGRLYTLFQDASENPSKYPPTGKTAGTVRSIVKLTKVPQSQKRRNKRKLRQANSQKFQQLSRQTRRQIAEGQREAVRIMEEENAEHERNVAEIAERIEKQPKFTITDGFGNTIMGGIPAEFILDAEGVPLDAAKGKIILPPEA